MGVLSDFFPIKRGCKQGDPIAPYLFIICAQVLCEMILTNKNINGIKIGSDEFKISQVFGSLSGLKMNLSKTKVIWIGKKVL